MSLSAPLPRICHLQKAFPEQEYGFNLHAEVGRGQYIGSVDFESPAEKAGLCRGDRIVAVNGMAVAQLSHKEVVAKIKENPSMCTLTVIDELGEQWYAERNMSVPLDSTASGSLKLSVSDSDKPLPRLCTLTKDYYDQEYGFNLHAERNRGHFIGKVDEGSVARRACLEEGQRIVGVNGTLVYVTTSHKEVVRLIKQDPMHVELLVALPEVDDWYRGNNVEYSFSEAEVPGDRDGGAAPRTPNAQPRVAVAATRAYTECKSDGSDQLTQKKEVTTISVSSEAAYSTDDGSQHQTTRSMDANDQVNGGAQYKQPAGTTVLCDGGRAGAGGKAGEAWTKLSAAEMRQYLQRHKKFDPRNQPLSMEKKYEIAQNL